MLGSFRTDVVFSRTCLQKKGLAKARASELRFEQNTCRPDGTFSLGDLKGSIKENSVIWIIVQIPEGNRRLGSANDLSV